MPTNPIDKDTKVIGINMDMKMAEELIARADSMHLSVSKYCKLVMGQWLESGNKLHLKEK